MKKTLISVALLSALVSQAQAVHLAPQHEGQVLIYPYYTVEQGQQTLITVRNNTTAGKAVQVRFRESENGRPVLSFHLYLGPNDVWTSTVLAEPATGDVPAVLTTADDSCTVPGIRRASFPLPTLPNGQNYVPFRNFGYTGMEADGGSRSPTRTRTGFVEIIEMGTLQPGTAVAQAAAAPTNSNCNLLNSGWAVNGFWTQQADRDLLPPSGGLSGSLALVDATSGRVGVANASALDAFSSIVQHATPGSETLTLGSAVSDASSDEVVSTALTAEGARRSRWTRAHSADAVSAALATQHIAAAFENGEVGSTEWVLTFPTRHLHTDPARVAAAIPPFTQRFVASSVAEARSCDASPVGAWDHDGQPVWPDNSLLPGTTAAQLLCGSVTRVGFGQVFPAVILPGHSGWVYTGEARSGHARFDFSEFRSRPALDGETWSGLPVIGLNLTELYRGDTARAVLLPVSGKAHCNDCN